MSVEPHETKHISSPSTMGADASSLASLFDAMESVVPAPDDGEQLLDDLSELVQLVGELEPCFISDTHDISANLAQHLHRRKARLSPRLLVRLLFWQTFFETVTKKSALDPQLLEELQRLRVAMVILGLLDQDLALNRQNPARQLIDILVSEGILWYPSSGKEGAAFFDAAAHAINGMVAVIKMSQLDSMASITEAFATLSVKQKARAEMMEKRCCESELGMAKIHRSQVKVMELLDLLVGCALPESMLGFIRIVLKGELQFILINEGETAGAWLSWSAIIKRLPQVFPVLPDGDRAVEPEPPNRQQLYRDVQIIVGQLDEHVTVSAAQQQAYDDGVEDFRERLFERLRGVSVPLMPFTPISVENELSRIGAAVSPSLLKNLSKLKIGDWFLFANNENVLVRCKLLLRPPEVEQLLFVNRSGHRVLQKSVQEFSACLATRIATPLVHGFGFDEAFAHTVEKLQKWVDKSRAVLEKVHAEQQLQADEEINSLSEVSAQAQFLGQSESSKVLDVERASADDAEAQSEPEVEQPNDPASNRKSAAQKALQEARVLARLEIRRERQRLQSESGIAPPTDFAADDDDLDKQIANLNPGAWVELPAAGSARLRCKLVAIMRSSNTYIFTDRHGVKVAEYDRAALTALLTTKSARIISNGDDFEGQLSKVVLTLRRDI